MPAAPTQVCDGPAKHGGEQGTSAEVGVGAAKNGPRGRGRGEGRETVNSSGRRKSSSHTGALWVKHFLTAPSTRLAHTSTPGGRLHLEADPAHMPCGLRLGLRGESKVRASCRQRSVSAEDVGNS